MAKQKRDAILPVFLSVLGLACLWWWDRDEPPSGVPDPASVSRGNEAVLPPHPQAALQFDRHGCLVPGRTTISTDLLERPSLRHWQVAPASADRLHEDACGNLWGLWFNSWTVSPDADPQRSGSVALDGQTAVQAIARAGVASTLGLAGELWILGRNGELARHDGQRWQSVPGLPGCGAGQLLRFDGDVWAACGPVAAQALVRWNAQTLRWVSMQAELLGPQRLAVDERGQLYAAGGGQLARYVDGPERQWDTLATVAGEVGSFSVNGNRAVMGRADGLILIDLRTGRQQRGLNGEFITGVVAVADGVWAAARNQGLHYFDGERWHRWGYAQGLASDEARDLLLDARGRLWLGGSPVTVIDAAAAARQIGELPPAATLGAVVHADACLAAEAELGSIESAGQVAQVQVDGSRRVFFDDRQVCPFPDRQQATDGLFWRRRNDGALLELGYNGQRGHSHCGGPCQASQLPVVREWWRIRLHPPPTAGQPRPLPIEIAPPDPLPEQSPAAVAALAANGDIWIATHSEGVWQRQGEAWRRHAQAAGFGAANLPQDLLEDAAGAIWVASYPQWNPEIKQHEGQSLQRWRDGRWRGWSPGDGRSAQTLHWSPGGVLVGSNGGVAQIVGESVQTVPIASGRAHVVAIAGDAGSGWWLAHGSFRPGLSLLEQGRTGVLSSREGLFADRLVGLADSGDGKLWLLADDGRVAVYPQALLRERMLWSP